MPPFITVHNLTKTYRIHHKEPGIKGSLKALIKRRYQEVVAVDKLSFNIQEGELVGFIGPNGAGKTTTLKVLSGILHPTSGKVTVLGFNPWQRQYAFLRQISLVMGQKNQLWWNLPAFESFRLFGTIYNLSPSVFKRNLDELVDLLDFSRLLNVQVRKLSLGERMKAELIAALLHQPKVLFLDEPTIGLDVTMQEQIRNFLKNYQKKFTATILLTSHYMGDVKALAERVIVINKGHLIYDGDLSRFIKEHAPNKEIEIILEKNVTRSHLLSLAPLKSFQSRRAVFLVPRHQVAQVVSRLLSHLPILDMNIKEPDLESIIKKLFSSQ